MKGASLLSKVYSSFKSMNTLTAVCIMFKINQIVRDIWEGNAWRLTSSTEFVDMVK